MLNLLGVQALDLEAPAASSTMGTLARFSMILADFEHVTRRARYVEEKGVRVFRGGQDRGTYYYQRLFRGGSAGYPPAPRPGHFAVFRLGF